MHLRVAAPAPASCVHLQLKALLVPLLCSALRRWRALTTCPTPTQQGTRKCTRCVLNWPGSLQLPVVTNGTDTKYKAQAVMFAGREAAVYAQVYQVSADQQHLHAWAAPQRD